MVQKIHQTAIIETSNLPKNIEVGAYSIINKDVKLGENIKIHSHVVIDGDTEISDNAEIFPFAAIGLPPQDLKYNGEKTSLIIGKNCRIREHVTIHTGTVQDKSLTKIGDNCLFMIGSHIAHDCVIGNNVIMANNATLAGHVHIGNNAIIGGLAAIRQWVKVGDFAMIGGLTGVENNVIPYGMAVGERGNLAGLNLIGLKRAADKGVFSKKDINELRKIFKILFLDKNVAEDNFAAKIEQIRKEYSDSQVVTDFINFIENTDNNLPLCRP